MREFKEQIIWKLQQFVVDALPVGLAMLGLVTMAIFGLKMFDIFLFDGKKIVCHECHQKIENKNAK